MRDAARWWRAALLGLLALGCVGGAAKDGRAAQVRDSLGVAIVENVQPRWAAGEGWRVSAEPTLRLGELGGPVEASFGKVRSVGWLADGRIYVGDEQAHTIRLFSPDGQPAGSIGREGQGPGELLTFLDVERYRGDSLWVYDYAQSRVTVFGPDGTYARGFPNPRPGGNYWVTDALEDGRFLLYSPGEGRLAGGPGFVEDSSAILLATPDGAIVERVGSFRVSLQAVEGSGFARPVHLGPLGAVEAAGGRILVTEGSPFQIKVLAPDGHWTRIIRKPHRDVAVTEDVIQAYKEHYLAAVEADGSADSHGGLERIRDRLDQGRYHSTLPAMAPDIRVDALGYLWVGRYHFLYEPTTEWAVFDPTGVWLGTVETPAGLDVHRIAEDRLIGVTQDELGVPLVQVHEIIR